MTHFLAFLTSYWGQCHTHSLSSLASTWRRSGRSSKVLTNVVQSLMNTWHRTLFFAYPFCPGMLPWFEDFLADLDIQLRNETGTTAHSLRLLHIGPVLFSLVILRVYLDLPDENNFDIFHLVEHNRVSRVWTAHEQALAACHGESNTSSNSPLAAPPTPLLFGITIVDDNELVISDDEPLVVIKSIDSVDWTSRRDFLVDHENQAVTDPLTFSQILLGPGPSPDQHTAKDRLGFC